MKSLIAPPSEIQPYLRLFCLPYAGGDSHIYRSWSKALQPLIDVRAIDLPGHGRKATQRLVRTPAVVVEQIVVEITPLLDIPIAFFGHSMGARLAFAVASDIRTTRGLLPAHLFLSAASPHSQSELSTPLHELPREEFLQRIRLLNGTPPEIFEDSELLNFVLPILRSDFTLDAALGELCFEPMNCPISAFSGSDDRQLSIEAVLEWGRYTTASFHHHRISGNHFFLQDHQTELWAYIRSALPTRLEHRAPL